MCEICLCQRSELELYISVAKCLSEMTDEGANQISQINKVTMCPSMHIFIIEAEILQEELFTMSFWPNMVLHKTCYWIILGY